MTSVYTFLIFLIVALPLQAQQSLWHGIERKIHYLPDGEDFLLVNGSRRFNRALYGGNTAFRVEAGDRPEFALYLPGMGGNLKFGLLQGDSSKWLIDAGKIETRYRPGAMIYKIEDPLLKKGVITITVIALYDKEAMLVKIEGQRIPAGIKLLALYGGATGKKFSRDGDIGADPESSFYLKPEYCKGNTYSQSKNSFALYYGSTSLTEEERYEIQYKTKTDSAKPTTLKMMSGLFPPSSIQKIVDAGKQSSPLQLYASADSTTPATAAKMTLADEPQYFFIKNGALQNDSNYQQLPTIFAQAEATRKELAGRIKVNTPDAFINTLGGALSVAADAVWEDPSFMHGAIAWRMRLNGWRGAYLADALGWHDRARKHFSSYALSQVTSPMSGPVVMDTAMHLARHLEKMGTSIFSSGYISRNPGGDQRPHHYDMNLVFIDQLLTHFLYTGDTAYVKSMWPVLKRHLAWEKRNFDVDGDGLYDAYAAIWASDALQYSGGGVTHSSSYNYRANKIAAGLASLVGEDAIPYSAEAAKILKAINTKLWMPQQGVYAEYKDLLGLQLLHPSPAVWTIYHAIDSYVPDRFQAYQSLKYIDRYIPHIPIRAKGLTDTTLSTISTTNWQPYTWSLNNVVLGEVMHTALAYWQGGRTEEAYKLWKGSLVESMYVGASPGNFQQLSFYDAIRGELYRDFADDIGMTARSLVEGLFGIVPDALHDTLHLTPGFPSSWQHASLQTPDIDFSFKKNDKLEIYTIISHRPKNLYTLLTIPAKSGRVASVNVNGKEVGWKVDTASVGVPRIIISLLAAKKHIIKIVWSGPPLNSIVVKDSYVSGETIAIKANDALLLTVYDPQKAFTAMQLLPKQIQATVNNKEGEKTFFVKVKNGMFIHWQPVSFKTVQPLAIATKKIDGLSTATVTNHTSSVVHGKLFYNHVLIQNIALHPHTAAQVALPTKGARAGTNVLQVHWQGDSIRHTWSDWDIKNDASLTYDKIDLSPYFNDGVNSIFKNKYLSPRPKGPTMQLPTQGIGNWAYPFVQPVINDAGLRTKAGSSNSITITPGIPFATPSDTTKKNILFTSQWDTYPSSATIPLQGKAAHAYFIMAGSTNPMQSRIINGQVTIQYQNGSEEKLDLKNPENWWPIEQDYYVDGFAFTTNNVKPPRLYFKTGEDNRNFNSYTSIKGFTTRAIEGGAGTVLDIPLNRNEPLKSIQVSCLANDVVIGLMSLTLVR